MLFGSKGLAKTWCPSHWCHQLRPKPQFACMLKVLQCHIETSWFWKEVWYMAFTWCGSRLVYLSVQLSNISLILPVKSSMTWKRAWLSHHWPSTTNLPARTHHLSQSGLFFIWLHLPFRPYCSGWTIYIFSPNPLIALSRLTHGKHIYHLTYRRLHIQYYFTTQSHCILTDYDQIRFLHVYSF